MGVCCGRGMGYKKASVYRGSCVFSFLFLNLFFLDRFVRPARFICTVTRDVIGIVLFGSTAEGLPVGKRGI